VYAIECRVHKTFASQSHIIIEPTTMQGPHAKPRDVVTVNAETPQARQLIAAFLSVLRYPCDAHIQVKGHRLAVLGPLVLAADLLLLLRREVVLDVERLADLVGRLALDHVCDSLAADVEQSLNVEVVGGLQVCQHSITLIRGGWVSDVQG
jgi:hypothetical protein